MHSETVLKEGLPQLFGIPLIDNIANDKAKVMIAWIPSPATEMLRFTLPRFARERD